MMVMMTVVKSLTIMLSQISIGLFAPAPSSLVDKGLDTVVAPGPAKGGTCTSHITGFSLRTGRSSLIGNAKKRPPCHPGGRRLGSASSMAAIWTRRRRRRTKDRAKMHPDTPRRRARVTRKVYTVDVDCKRSWKMNGRSPEESDRTERSV
jgi:hypothetical protein